MFNFFKRKGGKADAAPGTAEGGRKRTSSDATNSPPAPVAICAPRNDSDVTNDKTNTLRKDVVNLLLPDTNYNQKTGVGAFLDIMAGKRRKNKKRTDRTESCRVSPQKEMQHINLQRSKSDLEPRQDARDVAAPTADENTQDAAHAADDPADFVKALVLQKYANKPPTEKPQQHVSLVYVSNEPDLEEKRHAEALLREIARSIDCTIEQINVNKAQMGTTDSKPIDKDKPRREPVYETIDSSNNNSIDSYKSELKDELRKLLKHDNDETKTESQLNKGDETITDSTESLAFKRKSNLKLPKSDTEGCSDDDRSDCGKKRVTFRKHIVFDDGEQQTDEEVNSSFETISSEEDEEEEYLEDTLPDNDELLGGVVVSRNENDNKTVINVNQTESDSANEPLTIKIECSEDADGLKRISSDNSDSGFLEFSDKNESSEDFNSEVKSSVEVSSESEVSGSESESEIEEEVEEKIIEEIDEIKEDDVVEPAVSECDDHKKSLVSQESRFQSQVAALTELADSRCGEAERTRGLIAACRREIEDKEREIQRLKCELEAAYKESELVRQRSRSLEEELSAARSCSADLADQLQKRNDASLRQLRGELEDAHTRRAELESRVLALERDRDRLEQEKALQEQRAKEALTAAEATTAKWRSAHEAARSQAAARAERLLADCEWKMRELERKARDADKLNKELTQTVEQLKSAPPPASHIAELQQLRGLATEQQRSIQALTLQLQRVETREEALKLEVHRLKELLEKAAVEAKEKEERHSQAVSHLEQQHSQALERLKAEHQSAAAAARAASERAQAERTRAALAQLRAEAERDARNADRKLREVTTRYENLKEELASKQTEFQTAIAEAHSKADWDVMQLRHLLDRADISYANNMERMAEKHQEEKEQIIKEWTEKLSEVEERAATAASEAQKLLETTRMKLIAERNEQVNKLKEQHRKEMDEQWENFMTDKENCLARMKAECRQEGEEERVKREKDLLEEIAELRAEVQTKSVDFDTLATKAAACGRTLAVTEQELREALAREKELREKRAEDAAKIKLVERASREQVEHLTRKCACVRKLFDDMRARLAARERDAEQESRCKEKELHQLRAEVARLTKLLVENSSPALGARTRADGCETALSRAEEPAAPAEPAPRRKGGTLKTPEAMRKRLNLPELQPLPPEARRTSFDEQNGRRRAKSVDLPAVQVPVRIKQLEQKTKE